MEPEGFSKASEVTRCTSAEEGSMEEPLEWEGHGLHAEEVLHLEVASGGQGTGREAEDLLSCSSTQPEADHFPFPLQLLPLENISSSY